MGANIACVPGMLIVLLLTTGAVASEPPDKLQLVTALLSFSEKRLPDAVQSAEVAYQGCRDRFPDDVRIDYAYSLVLLRQQQYDASAKLLEKLVVRTCGETRLLAARTRLWILVQLHKYPDALQQVEEMAVDLPAEKPGKGPNDVTCQTALLVGQIIGYLEKPQAKAVPGDALERAKQRLVKQMSPAANAAFAVGREGAIAKCQKLKEQMDASVEEAKSRHQSAVQELENAKQKTAENRAELTTAHGALKSEVSSKLSDLQRRWQKVAPNLQAIESSISDSASECSRLRDKIRNLRDDIRKAKENRYSSRSDEDELSTRQQELSETEHKTYELNATAEPLRRECRAILAESNMLLATAGPVLSRQVAADARLQKEARAVNNRQERLDKARPATTGKAEIANRRMMSLSTYAEIPLEAEKKRILASLQK